VAERPGELAESERIKQDIDLTRERMSGTIDEIQERLHPARLLHDATATVRDAGVDSVKRVFERAGRTAERTADQAKVASAAAAGYARTHPLPAALLLAGLALVVARALGGRRTTPTFDDVDDMPNGNRSAANDIRMRPEYQDWGEPINGSRTSTNGSRPGAASVTSWMARNSLAVGAAVVAAGTVAGIRWANRPAQPPGDVRR
jgi:hypothetical protein